MRTIFTYKFMSRYGFLKLAIICSPDFDEFISSCKDEIDTIRNAISFIEVDSLQLNMA